ncbi:MAG TPA: TIGR01458 family HAD-type hydrolase [Actinomycetota bacterium]|nr:TIGR01458 family HAD-type hydrolase [Actinomycetota bacterium]
MAEAAAIGGVLLDLDGALVVSWQPLRGAVEALLALRDRQIPFALVTNTTTLSRRSLAQRLGEAGIEVEPGRVVTAATATAAYLRSHHPGAKCFLLATGDVAEDLDGIDLVEEAADVVVVAGAEDAMTYDAMNRAFRMLREGAALVAMHRNVWWMTSEGPKLDAGPYVTALEEAAGVRAVVVGKPSTEIFRESVALLGVEPERAVMVGDDLEADVLPAQAIGLTGVLVRTGKFRQETLQAARRRPDHVIDSVADLPELLDRLG